MTAAILDNLRRWLTCSLGLSDEFVRVIIQRARNDESGTWFSEQLFIQPTPSVKGTLNQLLLSKKSRSVEEADDVDWIVTVDSCHLVLSETLADSTDLLSSQVVNGIDVRIIELSIVSINSATLKQLHQTMAEVEFIASKLSIEIATVWNTQGEQQAQAHQVVRSNGLWNMETVELFESMKLQKIAGHGSDFTCQKVLSIPSDWGWRLLDPVERVGLKFSIGGDVTVQWLGNVTLEKIEVETTKKNRCRYGNINVEGDAILLQFKGWQLSCMNIKLQSDDDAMDGLIKIACDVARIPDRAEFYNPVFSGSIEPDGTAVHLCLASAKSMLLEANENTLAWLKAINESSTFLDVVDSPYAKVGRTRCWVRMSDLDLATSGIPLVTVDENEFDFETTLGTVIRLYATHFSEMITSRKECAALIQSDVCDSLTASTAGMILKEDAAAPVSLDTSFADVFTKDSVSATATAGKESRGASVRGAYQFAGDDVTRGIAADFGNSKGDSDADTTNSKDMKRESTSRSYLQQSKGRCAKVGGYSLGAAVGTSLNGGHIGIGAVSLSGGSAAKNVNESAGETQEETAALRDDDDFDRATRTLSLPIPVKDNEEQQQQEQSKIDERQDAEVARYKFGDLTRGVIARGKKSSGRSDDSSYKFGDFTRGLFGSS